MTDSRDQQFFDALNKTTRAERDGGPSDADTGPQRILSAAPAAPGNSPDDFAAPGDELDDQADTEQPSDEADDSWHDVSSPHDDAEDDGVPPSAQGAISGDISQRPVQLPPTPPHFLPTAPQLADLLTSDSFAPLPFSLPHSTTHDDLPGGRHHVDSEGGEDQQGSDGQPDQGHVPGLRDFEPGGSRTGMFDAPNSALQRLDGAPQRFPDNPPQNHPPVEPQRFGGTSPFGQPQRPGTSEPFAGGTAEHRDPEHTPPFPQASDRPRGENTGWRSAESPGTPVVPRARNREPGPVPGPVDEPTRFIPREVVEHVVQQHEQEQQRRQTLPPPPPSGRPPQSGRDPWPPQGGQAPMQHQQHSQSSPAPDYGYSPTPTQGPTPGEPDTTTSGLRPPAWDWGSPASGGAELRSEQISASKLVTPRKIASSRGWRKWLYYTTFKLINVGESPDQQLVRNLNATVTGNLRGTYSIVVLGGKGGVGKTTTTAAVGSTFAALRNDKTVAIDANPDRESNLADRIDPTATDSYKDVLSDQNLIRYSDIRSHVGQNAPAGLDVLGNRYQSDRGPLTARTYLDTHTKLQRFYSVLISDSGTDVDHEVIPGLMSRADALIMVASTATDGAKGAAGLLDWLWEAQYHRLLQRTVVVINDVRGQRGKTSRKLVESLVEQFSRWVTPQRVFVVPFDPHIASGDVIDINQLRPETARRFLEITAKVASGFNSSEDGR